MKETLRKSFGMYFWCIFLILLISPTFKATARPQDSTDRPPMFLFAVGRTSDRIGWSLGATYSFDHNFISGHVIYLVQFTPFIFSEYETAPASKDIEYAILYGLQNEFGPARVSLSTGISLVRSIHSMNVVSRGVAGFSYTRENVTSIGLPFDVRLHFDPGSRFSWALTFFANVNKFYSYRGGLFSIIYSIR